jgi:hypothetical protein
LVLKNEEMVGDTRHLLLLEADRERLRGRGGRRFATFQAWEMDLDRQRRARFEIGEKFMSDCEKRRYLWATLCENQFSAIEAIASNIDIYCGEDIPDWRHVVEFRLSVWPQDMPAIVTKA